MIGTKVAHYELTSHLGSGGMGDVYQATDTRLGRSVAIKFLPEAFSHDRERVARFQREARVLASLNHTNIAAIHDVEQIDNRHFLVMELVPGETLADRIKRGATPIEEALSMAKQIAEALEEAHEKGIIHRDLKPANIKVTPDGKVKVLDFGLAKAYHPEQADAALSNSPTLSLAATNAGVILGTAAYMSPEQAKGTVVDRRTDIYPRLSPDGTRILLDSRDQDNDIWLWDLRRQTLTNLTAHPALDRFPLWTAGGQQFIFMSDRDGASAIYRQAADGTGTAERLSEGAEIQQTPNAVSADGSQLVFDRDGDLFALMLNGNRRINPLTKTASSEIRAALSPDGRWLAYHGDESGRLEVFVRPFPALDTGKLQVSGAGGVEPWWGHKGNELFYFTPTGMLMSVTVSGSTTPTSGVPVNLFDARSFLFQPNGSAAATFDVSPDGSRFLMLRSTVDRAQAESSSMLVIVQNWFEEMKRLVPQQ
jgi:serine/threonine protein kinase